MTIDFGAPSALWLLAILPLVWLAGRAGKGTDRRRVYPIVRSAMLVCLVAALAQPVLTMSATRVAMVYLVDASHSVATHAIDGAAEIIDKMNAGLKPDDSRILVFGGRSTAVADTASLRRLAADTTGKTIDMLAAPDETNLEQALAAARAEIPPSANGRIVLFSDGRETEGDGRRIATRLAAERIPVFTDILTVRNIGDTWVEDVRLPRAAIAGTTSTVEVVVGSQVEDPADVIVRDGTRVLGHGATEGARGLSTVSIQVPFDTPGPHLLEAAVRVDRDPLAANNTLQREVLVEPRPRVLYVHAETDQVGTAPRALLQAGVDVTSALPQELPQTAGALDKWDVVLLSDVARSRLTVPAMTALGSWVENGGGLLFVGGNAVFGEGLDHAPTGYRHTEVERLLPVTFDRDDEPEVALVIVLDRSWSMNGMAMDLSKAAAEAAANTLAAKEIVGVISFNDQFEWNVPIARVRENGPTLHDEISKITASGPTAIYPPLEEAYHALAGVHARAKHVILLSDGQTAPEDFQGLVKKMTGGHITVSSVALGPEADVNLLRDIATWGGGRNYVVQDAQQIPEIFVKEAKNAGKAGADDKEKTKGSIDAVVRPTAVLDAATAIPALYGRNEVTRKPQAIELLATSTNEPLLTVWPVGLGRTAMLAADIDGLWTKDWMDWHGFGGFLSTLVRSLATHRLPASSLTVTAGERVGSERALNVALDARDRDGHRENLLAPVVEVRKGTADRVTLPLTEVGPGRYETRAVTDTTQPLTFSVVEPAAVAGPSRILVSDAAAEYRFADPDDGLLRAISATTGGVFHPTVADLSKVPRTSGVARHPLAPWFLALALVLWPIDICLRRFRR